MTKGVEVTIDQVLDEAHRALGAALVREKLLTDHIARLEAELAALRSVEAPAK